MNPFRNIRVEAIRVVPIYIYFRNKTTLTLKYNKSLIYSDKQVVSVPIMCSIFLPSIFFLATCAINLNFHSG